MYWVLFYGLIEHRSCIALKPLGLPMKVAVLRTAVKEILYKT